MSSSSLKHHFIFIQVFIIFTPLARYYVTVSQRIVADARRSGMGLLQDAVVPLESQVNAMTPKFTRMLTMAREEEHPGGGAVGMTTS